MDEIFYKHVLKEIAPEIFHTQFLNYEFTTILYDLFCEETSWEQGNYNQHTTTYDIHLNKNYPDLYNLIKERFDTLIVKVMSDIWTISSEVAIKNIFAVKYSEETQQSLNEHVDDSYISGSIKLNTNYSGGALTFPRQSFTNEKVPAGDLIIWPSQITHPHSSSLLNEGEKYSLTIWTDDKNNS
tara:strand:+ start:53 stop:604 length:552 start_codon:yes stop_codon:yes gene_type:complete